MRTLILHVQVQASFLDTHIGITFNYRYHIFLCISQPMYKSLQNIDLDLFTKQSFNSHSLGGKKNTLPWFLGTLPPKLTLFQSSIKGHDIAGNHNSKVSCQIYNQNGSLHATFLYLCNQINVQSP